MFKNCQVKGVNVDATSYHANKGKRGTKEFVMSPSALKLGSACWQKWIDGYEMPDSDAKTWGNLMDTRLLTPELFEKRFAVTPEYYERDGERKDWRNDERIPEVAKWFKDYEDKYLISSELVSRTETAIERLLADEIIAAWHEACDKQVHVVGEWHDKSGIIIPVECLIDYVPRLETLFAKCLGDFKTTRNAGLKQFKNWCHQAGYHVQGAFDLDLYCAATGEDRNTWCLVIQENYQPFQTGRRILSQDRLQTGRQTYRNELSRYCRYLKNGEWPGYDDHSEAVQGWSVIDEEPWMAYEALSDAMQADQEEATPEDESDLAQAN